MILSENWEKLERSKKILVGLFAGFLIPCIVWYSFWLVVASIFAIKIDVFFFEMISYYALLIALVGGVVGLFCGLLYDQHKKVSKGLLWVSITIYSLVILFFIVLMYFGMGLIGPA